MNAIANPAGFINRQWATQPDENRFPSLPEMFEVQANERARSATRLMSTRSLEFSAADPANPDSNLFVQSKNGVPAKMTNFAFGQLCRQVSAPASYLATKPAGLVADMLNYGYNVENDASDLGLLLTRDAPGSDGITVRAANGPKYGRIHNATITRELIDRFGDGVTGQWRQPGEFGQDVKITKANCTLYSGDRQMTVMLCDEKNRIEVPNRRDGKTGSLARGFFVWNSEVGAATLGVGSFWFDYVCMNRNIWGMQEYSEKTVRHTVSAPDRWLHEVLPLLTATRDFDALPVLNQIKAAQGKKIEDATAFLTARFTKRQTLAMIDAHKADEGRPIETLFDASNAATAFARTIDQQIERIAIERAAGQIMKLAA